jgi:hypothetical protein
MSIAVHMFECTDAEFEVAVVLLNGYVGRGLTKSYRIERAVDACVRLSLGQKQSAKLFGVKIEEIKDAIKYNNVMARLHSLPKKAQESMTFSHVKALGELAKNDNVLRAACTAVADTKMNTRDLFELTKQAREETTESGQAGVFNKFAKLNEVDGSRPVQRKIRNNFTKACQSIKAFKENKTWQSLEFNADQVPEAKALAVEVISILSSLCQADG